jgi:very-short-patch-repair endonuclease
LHGFDGFHRGIVEVVHHERRTYRSTPDVIVHVTSVLDAGDRVMVGPIPVTTPMRTLIDLGAVVRIERLEEALDGAERDGHVDRLQLIKRHGEIRQSGRNGVGVLAELLDARDATARTPQSVLERRMLRLLTGADLPRPECQLRVTRADGRTAFLDLAYPEIRLGIELDGQAWHATVRQRQRDHDRQNQVVLSDWTILRFTYEDVTHRPEHVATVVRRALAKTQL